MRSFSSTLILIPVTLVIPAGAQIDFDPAVAYLVGQQPAGVAIADFDGAFGPDLAVTSDNPEKVSVP